MNEEAQSEESSGQGFIEQYSGGLYALGAFMLWGLFPVYFKLVDSLGSMEILAHRIVWAVVLLTSIITILRFWPRVLSVLHNRKILFPLIASAILVSINWGVFIWAVNNDHILQASLGYYINPLVNVLLGVLFLKERLDLIQWVAVALVVLAVSYMVTGLGVVPWASLIVAFSFGTYGLIRKIVNVDAFTGLFIETILVVPIAAGYLILLAREGTGKFGIDGFGFDLLIILSGIMTVVSLVFFTQATKRLNLSTVGFFQYITPTTQFLLAIFIYGEVFTIHHMITFALIWTGLALFTYNSFRTMNKAKP